MKLSQLFLYISVAILGFWLIGFAFKLAAWIIDISLVIGLVLVILYLVDVYYKTRTGKKILPKK